MIKNSLKFNLLHFALLASCLWLLLPLTGCKEESEPLLPVPTVIFPENNPIFYPTQEISIKWDVPADAEVEVQLLFSKDTLLASQGEQSFQQVRIIGYSQQRSIDQTFDASMQEPQYGAFRLRRRFDSDPGPWTKIYYFRVYPLSRLNLKRINLVADFDFVTQQSGNYYSGLTRSLNKLNFDSLLLTTGIDTARIQLVKPVSGFIENHGNNWDDFQRISIGLKETGQGAIPFDVLGETQGAAQIGNLQYYPYNGIYRNLKEDLGGKSMNMFLAYFIAYNKSAGRQHRLTVNLGLDCYYE